MNIAEHRKEGQRPVVIIRIMNMIKIEQVRYI